MNKIPIRNIYYLLSYAWRQIPDARIGMVHSEGGDSLANMFARIIGRGFLGVARRYPNRSYTTRRESLVMLRGRGDWFETKRGFANLRGEVVCDFDELSLDTLVNQIIKATLQSLVNLTEVEQDEASVLRQGLRQLGDVRAIRIDDSVFRRVQLDPNQRKYVWLMDACWLVHHWCLAEPGQNKSFAVFEADQLEMSRIFEAFVRGFYSLEQTIYDVTAKEFPWDLEATDIMSARLLPEMRTDVYLKAKDETIIIDTKYYTSTLSDGNSRYAGKIRAGHLYQMRSYLETTYSRSGGTIRGILLYPQNGPKMSSRVQ